MGFLQDQKNVYWGLFVVTGYISYMRIKKVYIREEYAKGLWGGRVGRKGEVIDGKVRCEMGEREEGGQEVEVVGMCCHAGSWDHQRNFGQMGGILNMHGY